MAAASWPSRRERGGGRVDARRDLVHRQELADEAGRADDDVAGREAEHLGDLLGGAVRVEEAQSPGAGVGTAGVEHDGVGAAVDDDLARPRDGGRLDAVAREDGGRVVVGPVVDDEREVGAAARLEAGRDAGRAEARGQLDGRAPGHSGSAGAHGVSVLTVRLLRRAGRGSRRDRGRGWRTARRRRRCPW